MRILWTIANWKRTGPVEPSLDLAAAVAARGHDVHLLLGRQPHDLPGEARDAARDRGLVPIDVGQRMDKHMFAPRDVLDAWRVRRWLARERVDVCVATLASDHRMVRWALGRRPTPPVVRLYFDTAEEPAKRREAVALRDAARIVTFGAAPARRLEARGLAGGGVVVSQPPLDVEGTRARALDADALVSEHGVPADAFVLGIVARIQPHRRFDVLWDAMVRLRDGGVGAHLVVIGRGTRASQLAEEPIARLGLEGHVTRTGYLRGRAYASALAGLDAQLLLVPGTDPTVRALREGMALGVPSIVTRQGLLGDIVEDGRTGLVVDLEAEALADAVATLATDDERRKAMGAAAAERAEAFAAWRVAQRLEALLAQVVVPASR